MLAYCGDGDHGSARPLARHCGHHRILRRLAVNPVAAASTPRTVKSKPPPPPPPPELELATAGVVGAAAEIWIDTCALLLVETVSLGEATDSIAVLVPTAPPTSVRSI